MLLRTKPTRQHETGMHSRFKQMLEGLGLHRLEKSSAYFYPPVFHSKLIKEELSDEEYAVLLAEIDQFSAQFVAPKKQMGLEETSPV